MELGKCPVCRTKGNYKLKTESEFNYYWECQHITKHGIKCGHIEIERKEKMELPPPFYDSEKGYE